MKRRVVVTGMGIISPLGIGLEQNWKAVCEGKSGIDRITKFDASDFPVKTLSRTQNADLKNYFSSGPCFERFLFGGSVRSTSHMTSFFDLTFGPELFWDPTF